jgi:hypothetical protein
VGLWQAPIKSRRRSSVGDGRHSDSRSDPQRSTVAKRVSPPPPENPTRPAGRHQTEQQPLTEWPSARPLGHRRPDLCDRTGPPIRSRACRPKGGTRRRPSEPPWCRPSAHHVVLVVATRTRMNGRSLTGHSNRPNPRARTTGRWRLETSRCRGTSNESDSGRFAELRADVNFSSTAATGQGAIVGGHSTWGVYKTASRATGPS